MCERRSLLLAGAFLLLGYNLPSGAEGVVISGQAQSEAGAQGGQDPKTAQVTLLVRGMMKSRSGAT